MIIDLLKVTLCLIRIVSPDKGTTLPLHVSVSSQSFAEAVSILVAAQRNENSKSRERNIFGYIFINGNYKNNRAQ